MKRLVVAAVALTASLSAIAQKGAVDYRQPEQQRWAAHAKAITITRDTWGIAHVHGKTDADAVFGMIYTQCEDDFNRVENNYLVSLGRLSEADGEAKLWQDLRQQLFIDPVALKRDFNESPDWLKALMEAWADGANFYLSKHPEVKPRAISHFEPWMALSFTEGSIGGDIERVNLKALEDFYGAPTATKQGRIDTHNAVVAHREQVDRRFEPSGSNGAAIAPSNTKDHHALLLINPHTSFFFRSELQMQSDEGLNAYGAVTWGQIFVYQGFNERAGWMHTSSNVDAIDEFKNTIVKIGDNVIGYKYGAETRPFTRRTITLKYKSPDGSMKSRSFETYFDHRGPIVRKDGAQWVSIELMNTPIQALEQSFLRTKARTYAEYKKTMELMANSSNNTIFASADGDIAYWHGNYIPERDTQFDFTKPVDGTNPATDWQGLTPLAQIPQLHNPHSGWLENVNNAPWSGAGESSLKKADYPPYVEQSIETARGIHMVRVLSNRKDFTLDSLLTTAFDPYLPYFAKTIPALIKAYDDLPQNDERRIRLKDQIEWLRPWKYQWSMDSLGQHSNDAVALTLAIYWGEATGSPIAGAAYQHHMLWEDYVVANVTPDEMLAGLEKASNKLATDFGKWQIPWGEINRYQRLDDSITPHFDDAQPSIPIAFTPSIWGSLAAFGSRAYPNTKKRYGTLGNSFVAVVEFGPDRVRARAVTCGGESGHPDSPHFNDEQNRYASGDFREVMFYPDQLRGHIERHYHPGE
ncbi:MAG: penicillin acylase family protein [Terriglobus sp.]